MMDIPTDSSGENSAPVRRTARARKVNPRFLDENTDDSGYMKMVGRITSSNYSEKLRDDAASEAKAKYFESKGGASDNDSSSSASGKSFIKSKSSELIQKSPKKKILVRPDGSQIFLKMKTFRKKSPKKVEELASANNDDSHRPAKVSNYRSSTETDSDNETLGSLASKRPKAHKREFDMESKSSNASDSTRREQSREDNPNFSEDFDSDDLVSSLEVQKETSTVRGVTSAKKDNVGVKRSSDEMTEQDHKKFKSICDDFMSDLSNAAITRPNDSPRSSVPSLGPISPKRTASAHSGKDKSFDDDLPISMLLKQKDSSPEVSKEASNSFRRLLMEVKLQNKSKEKKKKKSQSLKTVNKKGEKDRSKRSKDARSKEKKTKISAAASVSETGSGHTDDELPLASCFGAKSLKKSKSHSKLKKNKSNISKKDKKLKPAPQSSLVVVEYGGQNIILEAQDGEVVSPPSPAADRVKDDHWSPTDEKSLKSLVKSSFASKGKPSATKSLAGEFSKDELSDHEYDLKKKESRQKKKEEKAKKKEEKKKLKEAKQAKKEHRKEKKRKHDVSEFKLDEDYTSLDESLAFDDNTISEQLVSEMKESKKRRRESISKSEETVDYKTSRPIEDKSGSNDDKLNSCAAFLEELGHENGPFSEESSVAFQNKRKRSLSPQIEAVNLIQGTIDEVECESRVGGEIVSTTGDLDLKSHPEPDKRMNTERGIEETLHKRHGEPSGKDKNKSPKALKEHYKRDSEGKSHKQTGTKLKTTDKEFKDSEKLATDKSFKKYTEQSGSFESDRSVTSEKKDTHKQGDKHKEDRYRNKHDKAARIEHKQFDISSKGFEDDADTDSVVSRSKESKELRKREGEIYTKPKTTDKEFKESESFAIKSSKKDSNEQSGSSESEKPVSSQKIDTPKQREREEDKYKQKHSGAAPIDQKQLYSSGKSVKEDADTDSDGRRSKELKKSGMKEGEIYNKHDLKGTLKHQSSNKEKPPEKSPKKLKHIDSGLQEEARGVESDSVKTDKIVSKSRDTSDDSSSRSAKKSTKHEEKHKSRHEKGSKHKDSDKEVKVSAYTESDGSLSTKKYKHDDSHKHDKDRQHKHGDGNRHKHKDSSQHKHQESSRHKRDESRKTKQDEMYEPHRSKENYKKDKDDKLYDKHKSKDHKKEKDSELYHSDKNKENYHKEKDVRKSKAHKRDKSGESPQRHRNKEHKKEKERIKDDTKSKKESSHTKHKSRHETHDKSSKKHRSSSLELNQKKKKEVRHKKDLSESRPSRSPSISSSSSTTTSPEKLTSTVTISAKSKKPEKNNVKEEFDTNIKENKASDLGVFTDNETRVEKADVKEKRAESRKQEPKSNDREILRLDKENIVKTETDTSIGVASREDANGFTVKTDASKVCGEMTLKETIEEDILQTHDKKVEGFVTQDVLQSTEAFKSDRLEVKEEPDDVPGKVEEDSVGLDIRGSSTTKDSSKKIIEVDVQLDNDMENSTESTICIEKDLPAVSKSELNYPVGLETKLGASDEPGLSSSPVESLKKELDEPQNIDSNTDVELPDDFSSRMSSFEEKKSTDVGEGLKSEETKKSEVKLEATEGKGIAGVCGLGEQKFDESKSELQPKDIEKSIPIEKSAGFEVHNVTNKEEKGPNDSAKEIGSQTAKAGPTTKEKKPSPVKEESTRRQSSTFAMLKFLQKSRAEVETGVKNEKEHPKKKPTDAKTISSKTIPENDSSGFRETEAKLGDSNSEVDTLPTKKKSIVSEKPIKYSSPVHQSDNFSHSFEVSICSDSAEVKEYIDVEEKEEHLAEDKTLKKAVEVDKNLGIQTGEFKEPCMLSVKNGRENVESLTDIQDKTVKDGSKALNVSGERIVGSTAPLETSLDNEEGDDKENSNTAANVKVPRELTPEQKEEKRLRDQKVVADRLNGYVHLQENLYLMEKKKTKRAKEVRRMVCDCSLTKEEISANEKGCGEDCLNRLLMIECGSRCPLKENCLNKNFQNRNYMNVEVFNADEKGCGVRACEEIPDGSFIMEYIGEVFDVKEFKRRRKEYAKESTAHFYFMALQADTLIDATRKGNISRFFNHSCDPNAETQKNVVHVTIYSSDC